MENKYYTPSIEEFHVGFEYEQKHKDGSWVKSKIESRISEYGFGGEDYIEDDIRCFHIRVKYLDSSDIEGFGFSVNDTIHFHLENMLFAGKNKVYKFEYKHLIYFIQHLDGLYEGCDNKVIVSVYNNETMKIDEHPAHLFNGKIKNKSELSRLLKQLSII